MLNRQRLIRLLGFLADLAQHYDVQFGETTTMPISTVLGNIDPSYLRDAAELNKQLGEMMRMTDDELRHMWKTHGGDFFGPRIETGSMPEALLLPLMRALMYGARKFESVEEASQFVANMTDEKLHQTWESLLMDEKPNAMLPNGLHVMVFGDIVLAEMGKRNLVPTTSMRRT